MMTRIITSVVGIAISTFIIKTGGILFSLMGGILAVLTWQEYARAWNNLGYQLMHSGTICIALLIFMAYRNNLNELMAVIMLSSLLIMSEAVISRTDKSSMAGLISLAGISYIGLAFAHLIMLRSMDSGQSFTSSIGDFSLGEVMVWLMFIGTWSSDSFAYFVGSATGKHPLAPKVSPKKTIEGFAGAIIGTMLMTTAVGYFFALALPIYQLLLLGALIAIVATMGDLVESLIKRYTSIKDSGTLIPGHGGVWDRFDSILFTAPLVYYFTILFI